ncbi:glycoside hydrolase family 76 protein [Humibacter ginsenosidimutans]|uniref:Glycosyl hydrolase n=1 Tax=Humibacter ginsenosidimutans TaxID=2599293 RepID=A0A5B8M504_9MICO|nr:glycoside hydrolase family 76 protein [Humibacter ginsenosidimutans]QDZ15109.1 glycosyl hydrolase [Humibacter ginsenosidimutans]
MLSRRTLLKAGLGAVGGAALSGTAAEAALASPAWPPVHPGNANSMRALESWSALQRFVLANDGSNLVHETYPAQSGDPAYGYEWSHSQVHVAALDLVAMRPSNTARAALSSLATGQEHYWENSSTTGRPGYASGAQAPYGNSGDLFYDDNAWVALEKIQLHLMTGDKVALQRAEQIFALLQSGWDDDPTHPDPGGVFWTQASWSQDRNTVSNMPTALIGARLYAITGNRDYLTGALRSYDWTNRYLLDTDGLYFDHVSMDGSVEKTKWSYNQGIPLAAAYALYLATHDRRYLDHAVDVAQASYEYYVESGSIGQQPIYFNSIYFKSLLLLSTATRSREYYDAMNDYGDLLWSARRDASTGLFSQDISGATKALEQGAAVQVYASLAANASSWSRLY